MPVILDDLDLDTAATTSTAPAVTPQFFSSKLTGSGKKVGLLNNALLPVNTTTNINYRPHEHIVTKASHTQHGVTTSTIPLAPLTRAALESSIDATVPVPHAADRFTLAVAPTSPGGTALTGCDVLFDMIPQACVLYEDESGNHKTRNLVIQYRMGLFLLDTSRTTEPEHAKVTSPVRPLCGADALLEWSTSPLTEAADFIDRMLGTGGRNLRMLNADEFDQWLRDYDIHGRITRQAQIWSSDEIGETISRYATQLPAHPATDQLNVLANLLRYLENYDVPLDAYRAIHRVIETTFPTDIATELSKQNLNLLMNHTLDQLEQAKPQLTVPARPIGQVNLPSMLSAQQRTALTTHDPLVMVASGAGCGKTSVVMNRIDYLNQCGVESKDVTVLSFTNVAADTVTERNENVGSMTIARMIHDIYTLNHPGHELSSIDTIINSLDIFYPGDTFAATLRRLLLEVDQNKAHAFTAMNTFIERNFDQVIATLDRIRQTSLELEIIVCYQRIDTMSEPGHVQCRYLIIDEVQDNSIFEFIYVLKYIAKHRQSLFIVGDASQTLYEFRSANPKALNTLEGSGVFTTFKLTTNYRSNQEILDFANITLAGLETNRFAGIQLRADSLAVPTAASFEKKVTVDYRRYGRISEFESDLPGILRVTVCPDYVDECLARGEQVAFLARTRREVSIAQQALEANYPNEHVANLVSERVYATDIFSKYVKLFWDDVLQVPPGDAAFVIHQGINDNLEKLTRNAKNADMAVRRMTSNWWTENASAIVAWVDLFNQGGLPADQFFARLRDNVLSFEIRHNAVRQSLMNQKNRERKAKNAEAKSNLVVSTIHGAKGMEFDNVVVIHKDDSRMSQDLRRMYYVALTRAMNTEYVLSRGTLTHAPIETNHQMLVTMLEKRDKIAALRAAGIDPDLIDDLDEVDLENLGGLGETPQGSSPGSAAPRGTDEKTPA